MARFENRKSVESSMTRLQNSFSLLADEEGDEITALVQSIPKKIDAPLPKNKKGSKLAAQSGQYRRGQGRRFGWDKSGGSIDVHCGHKYGNAMLVSKVSKDAETEGKKTSQELSGLSDQYRGGQGRRFGYDRSGGSYCGYGYRNAMLVSKVSKDAETKGMKTSQEVSGYVSNFNWNGEQQKSTKEEEQKKKERGEYTQKKAVEEKKEAVPMTNKHTWVSEMIKTIKEREAIHKQNSDKKMLKKKDSIDRGGSQVELPSSNMEEKLASRKPLKVDVGEETETCMLDKLDIDDIGVCQNKAVPMIDVCSVTIYSNDGKLCKIYGKIYYHDVEGATFYLYKREQHNAKTISYGGNLLLDCRRGGVMAAPVMLIELKDKAHDDAWFAKGQLVLDTETEDSNAEVKFATYEGNFGKVFVNYTVIPCAVVADVKVELIKADNCEIKDVGSGVHCDIYGHKVGVGNNFYANVCGTVVARYGKTYRSKISQHTLYSQQDQPQEVTLGTPIKLSRPMVCVPVYSSFIIELDLRFSIGDEVIPVDWSQELNTLDGGTSRRRIEVLENICIQVSVCWCHPYWIFPWKRFNEASNKETKASRKSLKPHVDKQLSSAMSICRNPSLGTGYGSEGLQVFSVFICHGRNEILSLCGTIRASHNRGTTFFFKKDKNCPEVFDPHCCKTVSLKGRLNFSIGCFGLYLNLNDVEEHVVVKGYLTTGYYMCFGDSLERDKPLCSIIRGDNAYAAVHYAGLAKALEATVNIFVVFNDSSVVSGNVHGRIIARYGNYKYASLYQAKCYQCVLFEKRENDKEVLTEASQARFSIPLSLSKILVPVTDTLVIEADIHVCFEATGISQDEHLTGNAVFGINSDGKSEKIEGQYFQIGFSIEWHDEVW